VTTHERDWLAQQFEGHRARLRAVAYRMLGSLSEAEDAVQESWLRLSRADTGGVENLGAWLTTVVAHVCFDMLRSRESRREEPLDERAGGPRTSPSRRLDPEQEAVLADSVGLALLVVLEKLTPAERVAFVLHDMFAIPFEDIAPIVGRSPTAARQLASRARRRVQGPVAPRSSDLAAQRELGDAFLTAIRRGDVQGLLAVLDPDVVLRTDAAVPGGARELRGAEAVIQPALRGGARAARPALVDGAVGIVVAPRGRLMMVLRFRVASGKIVEIEGVAERGRLAALDLVALEA
jgi:RNA polymerase sigma factor (sigma-70 family)